MLTHVPFKTDVLPVIEEATDPFRSRPRLQFVDATTAPGRAILSAHGIHEHLPVVLFIDDEDESWVHDHGLVFRGFPGADAWTAEDLAAALESKLPGMPQDE